MYRQLATLVDKIFRGAKRAELPVEQPNDFTLAINLSRDRKRNLSQQCSDNPKIRPKHNAHFFQACGKARNNPADSNDARGIPNSVSIPAHKPSRDHASL